MDLFNMEQPIEFFKIFYNSKYPLYIVDESFNILFISEYIDKKYKESLGKKCYEHFFNLESPCNKCPYRRSLKYNDIIIEESKKEENLLKIDPECIKHISFPIKNENFLGGLVLEYDNTKENLKFVEKKNEIHALKDRIQIKKDLENEKDLYYRNLVHELGKIVNNIDHINNQLIENIGGANKNEYYEGIEHLIKQGQNSINKLLKFNQINRYKLDVVKKQFHFFDIINEIKEIYEFMSKERNIKFTFSLSENAKHLYIGDRDKIIQIMRNILDNAFDFTVNGYVKVTIMDIEDNSDESIISITVKDSGIGIPEEQIKSIYNDYYKIDNKLSNTFGKVGLGLAISKSLVDLMKGNISISSTLGVGTTVSINLILNKVIKNSKPEIQKNDKTKVLIIGVEELFKYILKMKMQDEFDIKKVSNAEKGLMRYYRYKPDIVLIDVMSKGLNGFDFYDEVKRNDTHNAFIIVTSNKIIPSEEEYLMSYGFDAYIPKPIEYNKLIQVLSKFKKEGKNEKN